MWHVYERKSFDPNATRQEANDLFAAWDVLWQGAWHRPMVGAFLNVAFDMLTLYFLFVAAGENVSLGVLLAGYGLPLLLGKVAFIIPGGVGVVESSMAALYTGLGVPQATSGGRGVGLSADFVLDTQPGRFSNCSLFAKIPEQVSAKTGSQR